MKKMEKEKIIYIPDDYDCNNCQFCRPGNAGNGYRSFCNLFSGYTDKAIEECIKFFNNGGIILVKKLEKK